LQCNHGGLEPGFDPRGLLDAPEALQFQFLGELRQRQFLKDHPDWAQRLGEDSRRLVEKVFTDFTPESPTAPSVIGFMWNDFSLLRGETQFAIDPGRALVYGDAATRGLLERSSGSMRRLRAVFRAHQQAMVLNPMMRRLKASRGVFRHWQEKDAANVLQAEPAVLAELLEHGEQRAVPP